MSITIVTGAGSGMGRALALSQVAKGNPVLAVGRREGPLRETARLSDDPALVTVATGDLGNPDDVEAIVASLGDRPVRAVVAVAGGQGTFKDASGGVRAAETAWTEALRKNLFSAILLIEGVLARIEDGGRIVLIGSTAGLDGEGGPYATAKAALHGYGRDLARRVGERGITVNTIAPGFVGGTEFFEAGGYGDPSKMVDAVAAKTLLGRVGTPDDIVGGIEWLLSPGAAWLTGQTISINGGSVLVR